MMANFGRISPASGKLRTDLHPPHESLYGLLDFIADQLPKWRDDPDRPPNDSDRPTNEAENALSDQLCSFLDCASRQAPGWDIFRFSREHRDAAAHGRSIDIAVQPAVAPILVGAREYSNIYAILLPIECKRLPTPRGKDRDEWEYIINRARGKSTGGIQRFKAGHHGASHAIGAMIGYIQQDTRKVWLGRVSRWIGKLAEEKDSGWSKSDKLHKVRTDEPNRMTVLRSKHDREGLEPIHLRHLWLEMH